MRLRILAALLLLAAPAGCKKDAASMVAPAPQAISDTAIGQFCGMALTEHPGPKGQIFVGTEVKPYWFASVRDAVAFTMLPEMPKNLTAIYVTDMEPADAWDHPAQAAWIDARKAVFVIGGQRRSGMDTAEAVPFSNPEAAQRYATAQGGKVVGFADIPQAYVLSEEGSGS